MNRAALATPSIDPMNTPTPPPTVPSRPVLAAVLSCVLGLLAFAVGSDEPKATAPPAKKEEPPLDDPVPIQRVVLPAEKLVAEIDRAKLGVYRQMPRPEFESLVQRAARVSGEAKEPPRLVEGLYRARLETDAGGNENLIGSGEWKIVSLGSKPSLLPVEPLSLALQQTRWPDNRYAVLGALDPKSPGGMELLVDSRGEKSLYFDWSSRGVLEPGETRFDLQVPLAPVARLELNLPPDLRPFVAQSEVLVSGPVPQGEGKDRRHVWTLAFGGLSELELLLRKPPDATRPSPLIRSRTSATQTLASGHFLGKFDVNWEVFRGTVRDLTVLLDGNLTPTEVVVNNLESWRVSKGPNARKQLSIRLREPARGGRLEISATAPLFTEEKATWTSPGVELAGALSRGESLELRLGPDLLFADWQPGHFQLTNTRIETDRTQVFTLQSSFINEGMTLQRPQARIRTPGSDFQVHEQTEWHLTPEFSTLTAQYQLEVTRGGLMQFPVQVPKEWELDLVETPVKEMTPYATRQGTRLHFEFPRPVLPGQKFHFTAKFIQRAGPPATVPFPEITPLGSPRRSGNLRVKVSPAYRVTVTVPPTGEPPVHTEGVEPAWDIKYTGLPPAGTVHLSPRPASISGRAETEVAVFDREVELVTRFYLNPERGLAQRFEFETDVPVASDWKWETLEGNNRVVATSTGLAEVLSTGLPGTRPGNPFVIDPIPPRQRYSIRFARPIDAPLTLQCTYRPERPTWSEIGQLTRTMAVLFGGRWPLNPPLCLRTSEAPSWGRDNYQIPQIFPHGFEFGSNRISFRQFGTESFELHAIKHGVKTLVRTPNLEVSGNGPSLQLSWGRSTVAATEVRSIRLTTAIDRTPHLRHHLDFTIDPKLDASLTLDFEKDDFVEAVAIDGRTPSLLKWVPNVETGGNRLELPLPGGNGKHRVELVYHRPREKSFFVQGIEASIPKFAVETPPVQHVWRLGPGFDPALREKLKHLPGGEFVSSVYRLPAEIRDEWTDLVGPRAAGAPAAGSADPAASLEWMLYAGGLDWTAWESGADGSILVVRERAMFLVGGFLACGVVLFAGFRVRRSRQFNSILLQIGFFIAVVAALLLPDSFRDLARGPLLALFIVAVAFVFSGRKERQEDRTVITHRRLSGSSTGKLVTSMFLLGCPALCAAPEVFTVYLLPGGQSVLVPPPLLDRLRELAEEPLSLPGCVVLRDEYALGVNGNLLEGKAKLLVHSFADGSNPLALPLSGVRLREVLLDGAQAFPVAGTDRVTVEVKGKGEHRLEVAFTVPITGQGADRDVRFGVPETAHGKVEFSARADDLRELELLNWRGQQRLLRHGNRITLLADLGRAKSIHFRWRQEEKKPRTPPRVTELYYWDLDPSSATLYASLEYRFPQGSAERLHLAVPKELEVTRVELRPVAPVNNPPPAWVRDWRFASDQPRDGFRHLVIDLQVPVTQLVRLQLELTPVKPMSGKPLLTFPFALEVSDSEAIVAFRAQRLDLAAEVEKQGAAEYLPPASFRDDHWSKVVFGPNAAPTRAARRVRDETTILRPVFKLPSSSVVGSQELTWFLSDRRSEVRAKAAWKSPNPNLTFVEWELPAQIVLSEVRGDEVRAWSRSGSRVQVWLQKPCEEVKLGWTGSVPRPDLAGERFAFDLPNIRLEGVGPHPTELTFQTLPGWLLRAEQVQGLNSLPGDGESPRYEARQLPYGGRFSVIAPQADASFKSTQTVRVHEGVMILEARIVPKLRKDRRHEFALDLTPFRECEATLRKLTPNGAKKLTPAEKNRWSLSVLENESDFDGYALTLTKPLPGQEFRLPAVRLFQGDLPMAHETDLTFESDDWRLAPPRSWTGTNPWRTTDDEAILAPTPRAVAPLVAEPLPSIEPFAPIRYPLFTFETLIRTGILLLGLMLFGLLIALRGPSMRWEQVGLCGVLAGLGFELPEALVGGAVAALMVAIRIGWLARRAAARNVG